MDKPRDKTYLKALLNCLKISKSKIKLDECHDYVVEGTGGKIYTVGAYWYIYFDAKTPRKWVEVKKKLSWMEVQNDGDWEGIFRADFPPNDEQAAIVRKILKIRISKQLTEAERAMLFKSKETLDTEGVLNSYVR